MSKRISPLSLASAVLGAGALFLAASASQASILPAPAAQYSAPDVQLAWCAVGAHIGPVGGCIGGWGPGYRHHCWINRYGRRVCN